MKIFRKSFLPFFIGIMLMAAAPGCTLKQLAQLAEDKSIEVKPAPLELHGDSVVFTMNSNLPDDLINKLKKKSEKGFSYVLEIGYQPLQKEVIEQWQVNVTGESPNPMTKEFAFLNTDEHTDGGIVIRGYAQRGDQRYPKEEMEWTEIAKGIIRTSELVQPSFYPTYIDHGYKYVEKYEQTDVAFYFLQGSANLRYSEKRGDQAETMENYIAAQNATKTITITGMHSPEGPEVINSNLASDRANVIKEFYQEMMEQYDYTDEAKNINFVIKPVVEEWKTFLDMLSTYDGVDADTKNEMKNIINGPGEFRTKELKLQKVPGYRKVFNDLYPQLRTAKAEIIRILPQMTEAEIIAYGYQVAKGTEDSVGLEASEMAFAAFSQEDLDDREMMYKYAIKKYDDARFYNNLGAIYLEKAQKAASKDEMMKFIDLAITQFELSIKRKESPQAYVNIAGAKLMKGDDAGAMSALNKASGKATGSTGVAVNALKGYFFITQGKYEEALSNLVEGGDNGIVLYNKALAYLLRASKDQTGDYSKAKAAFEQAIQKDSKNAYAYYGMAIVASRMNDEGTMLKHLTQAASLNEELKQRAVSDLEFVNYWAKQGFKNALK